MDTPCRPSPPKPRPITDDPFVGKFFHTPPCEEAAESGRILARFGNGHYFIMLYPSKHFRMLNLRGFRTEEVRTWLLFKTRDEMELSYPHSSAS